MLDVTSTCICLEVLSYQQRPSNDAYPRERHLKSLSILGCSSLLATIYGYVWHGGIFRLRWGTSFFNPDLFKGNRTWPKVQWFHSSKQNGESQWRVFSGGSMHPLGWTSWKCICIIWKYCISINLLGFIYILEICLICLYTSCMLTNIQSTSGRRKKNTWKTSLNITNMNHCCLPMLYSLGNYDRFQTCPEFCHSLRFFPRKKPD